MVIAGITNLQQRVNTIVIRATPQTSRDEISTEVARNNTADLEPRRGHR